MKAAILGAGAWGTSLANLLVNGGHEVVLWDAFADHLAQLEHTRRNDRFLPGIALAPEIGFESQLARATATAELAVVALPSRAFREVTAALADFDRTVVSVTKGIEHETGLTMSGILGQTSPRSAIVALSGPTLALEVARGIPTAIVAASRSAEAAKLVQRLFHGPTFRVYTSTDILGVELGGALKNVIAIGAGVADGLGYGDNAKAALITRGIAEMRRLGVAAGAHPATFSGLSGLGDLAVTCFSRLSRNRAFGERLGRGEKVLDVVPNLVSVAEGYPTSKSAYQLARRLNVETPIMDQIYAMLHEDKDLSQAVRDLMTRDFKHED
jgi:glycerol-3-phosphate dehydrogenase (NAD(P)+)